MAGTGERPPLLLLGPDVAQVAPTVGDVAGGAPRVGETREFGGIGERRIVREAVDNVAARGAERFRHRRGLGCLVWVPVVFQIVETPRSPLFRVGRSKGIGAERRALGYWCLAHNVLPVPRGPRRKK